MKNYVVGMLLLLALLVGCSEKQESNELQKMPLDLEAGRVIAESHCAGCHGVDGRASQDDIPNLAAQKEAYLLKVFQSYDHGQRTRSSGDVMEIAEELNASELRNVLGYYANLPPLATVTTNSDRYSYYDRGDELSSSCHTCHGSDGNPSEAGIPRLAGQHPEYLIKALKAYQDGSRAMPNMPEKLRGMSQADLENIALFFALQKPKSISISTANAYDGKQFTYNCTECHGSKGSSKDAAVPNLAGQDVKYLSAVIKAYRDDARDHGQMHKLLGELGDAEIDKIALFFAAEEPMPVTFMQPEPIYTLAQKCARCHNTNDENPAMLAPKLDGQNRSYLINALTVYRDGERGSSAMHRMSSVYSNATIEGIAGFYSAQPAK